MYNFYMFVLIYFKIEKFTIRINEIAILIVKLIFIIWYSHNGVRTGKRGRPRIKGEKIDFEKLDLQRCEILDIEGGRAYSVKAYSKAMKRNIKAVVHYPKSGGHKIYFSTDLDMSAKDIIEYYRTRFQIEFCYASLASVNIAKVMRKRYYPSLSIGLLKACLSNSYMLKRIFSKSGLKPNRTFNTKLVKELFGLVAEAA